MFARNMVRSLMVVALLLSEAVYAADQCTSWGCRSKVSVIYTRADGDILIGTPLNEKLANCTPVSGVYFTLKPDAQNAREVYSSVLSAYMSGKKIQLRIKEGTSGCEISYVVLNSSF